MDLEKIEKRVKKSSLELVKIKLETDRQEGDIAGTKLLKFFNYLSEEIKNLYEIKNKNFEYTGNQSGIGFFVVKPKKEIIQNGPLIYDKKNFELFKMKHKNIFIKNKRAYSKEKIEKNLKDFLKEWKSVNFQKIVDMKITNFEVN